MVDLGVEILIRNPGFVLLSLARSQVELPLSIPLHEQRDFRFQGEVVTSLITYKSRTIIMNSPNNPKGGVLNYDDFSDSVKSSVERDMIVISDEVYEKIIYDGMSGSHALQHVRNWRER